AISDRLARERGKYSDYDDLKDKAQKYAEYEEAQKSELQKAKEAAEAAEQREKATLVRANEGSSRRSSSQPHPSSRLHILATHSR
ncbi:MAG TPA: hypothetical protein VM537_17885, partial [Anaerolineae bacterium]|nr:hypothetical protein [Anaerolineae bacterium]